MDCITVSRIKKCLSMACTGLLLAGCSHLNPHQPDPDPGAGQKASAEMAQYRSCMKAAARHYLSVSADAQAIAMAAQSRCEPEFGEYRRAFTAQLEGLVSPASHEMARQKARAHAEETRRRMQEQVVQWVLDARMVDQ